MEEQMIYDELLDGYNKDDYVYIIEGCFGPYVDFFEPELEPCEFCGETPYVIMKGYVEDLISSEKIDITKCYYEKQIKELVEKKLYISYNYFKNLVSEEQERLLSELKEIYMDDLKNDNIKILTNIKKFKRNCNNRQIEYKKKGD